MFLLLIVERVDLDTKRIKMDQISVHLELETIVKPVAADVYIKHCKIKLITLSRKFKHINDV